MLRKLLLFVICIWFFVKPVSAAGEFATSYDVLYDVGEDGITTVTEKVSLKNLTSEYYANQFKLTIGSTQISDIKASDPGGALEVTKDQKDTSTTIGVKFNQQVAGLGKSLPWTISFKSKDFAERIGKVWEVRAPRISSSTNLEVYNLTLVVPESFGQPSSVSPTPKSQTTSSGKIFLTFDKSQLLSSGISANFGTNQLFDFDLSYHLENNSLVSVLTNIALPPDTPYQDVIYQRIDPKPLNVTVDNDGNYLAWFRLNRSQKLNVQVIGSAKLYANSKVKNPVLDNNLREKYTSADKYWEKDNPQIVTKLNEILTDKPTATPEEKVKFIYQFVVNNLKYDSSRITDNIERLGAVTALSNLNSAVCMEFTDLFIALTRTAGIPSREIDGYAYTANTTLRPLSFTNEVLHAWPEYWDDKKGWVMVDPTWENTTGGVDYFNKFDLNHFAFVVRGFSSTSPIPAGSYKQSLRSDDLKQSLRSNDLKQSLRSNDLKLKGQETHDVKVTLSDQDFLGHPQIDVQINTPDPILSGFPTKLKVKITNIGNAVYPSVPLILNADNLIILNSTQPSGLIPAFGAASFEFDVRTKSLFDKYPDKIILLIGSQKIIKDIQIKPFILFQTAPLIFVTVVALIVLIYASVLGVHIYKKKASVKQKNRKS